MGAPIALLGSGEFEDWNAPVDRWLIDSSQRGESVLILPTASAPEGDEVFDKWGDMGTEYFRRLGASPEVLPIKTRADADEPAIVGALEEASLVYFSGGNPAYLVRTLKGTQFWSGLLQALRSGAGLAGCSAGANWLGGIAADTATMEYSKMWTEGMSRTGGRWLR